MKTTDQIVLFQDEAAIQKLTEGTALVAEALTNVWNQHKALNLPEVTEVNQLLNLRDVESHIKRHIEKGLTDDDLKVNGAKLNRKKVVDLIDLPNFSSLEEATLRLQDLLTHFKECRNPELYKLDNAGISVNEAVHQCEIDKRKTYATKNQAQILQAIETIATLYNENILPALGGDFMYIHPNSLPSSPRYILESEKFFRSAFVWDGSNCSLTTNSKFVADLVR